VILGDVLIRRGLATQHALRDAVRRWGSRRGARVARIAVELVDGRSQSPMETRVRLLLVDAGFTGFLVNQPAVDDVGGFLATPDLQFRTLKVAIEYEGDQHRTDPKQWGEDIKRYELLQQHGWIVIRLIARDVFVTPAATARRIQDALERQARRLAS
jgi:very-short-patch-repair endonuclease